MSVYVDGLINHGWVLGPNCHMIADTLDELHAMADRIGLRRAWFQQTSVPHYDLTASRRRKAIAAGAVPLGRREYVAVMRRVRAGAA